MPPWDPVSPNETKTNGQVTNAYVSGMKEDLAMTGNEYNLLTTYWIVGYILGNIPSQLVLTRVPASLWLPSLELAWGFVVVGMAGARSVGALYALRFAGGLLEASAYPGVMTLLGTWYTPAELGKRACLFQASSSAAQLFSGYLQAGLYAGMDGRLGLAAWRWLFVFDGIIGIPVALYGYVSIPDSPAATSRRARWLLRDPADRALAVGRMARVGRAAPLQKRDKNRTTTWAVVRASLASWPAWLFSALFVAHVLGIRVYTYFNLWLRATGRWDTEQVNEIPSAGYALQIATTLAYAWISDALRTRWPVVVIAATVALIGATILAVYPEDNHPAMMAGWLLTFCETGAGALVVTWANEMCAASAEQRAVVLGVMETMAFAFAAWVPLFIYDTGEAPRFRIGYKMAAMFFAVEIVLTPLILWCEKRWPQGKEPDGVISNT